MTQLQLVRSLFETFLSDLLSLIEPKCLDILDLSRTSTVSDPGPLGRPYNFVAVAPLRHQPDQHHFIYVGFEIYRPMETAAQEMRRSVKLLQARLGAVLAFYVALLGDEAGIQRKTFRVRSPHPELTRPHYHSFGVSGCRAENYLDRPEPLAWALAALMEPGRPSRAELKLECLKRIFGAGLGMDRTVLLLDFVMTFLRLGEEDTAEYERLKEDERYQAVGLLERFWAELLREEGRRVGQAQGSTSLT